MKIKLLPVFLLLVGQLCSCGFAPSAPLDERFYGTWVHPLNETEPVVFREDDTVSWFGEEGTFGTYKYHTECNSVWVVNCLNIAPGTGLEVALPSGTFTLLPGFDRHPNSWWFYESLPAGRKHGLLLFREGSFERPIMPSHFEKLGAGWGITLESDDNYSYTYDYKDSYTYYSREDTNQYNGSRSYFAPRDISVNPVLVDGSKIYNEPTDTWSETLPYLNEDEDLPPLPISNAFRVEYLTGNRAIRQVDVTPEPVCNEEGCTEVEQEHFEIWTIDTDADSPSWTHRRSFTLPWWGTAQFFIHPTTSLVSWHFFGEEGETISEISYDRGTTWESFDNPCQRMEVTYGFSNDALTSSQVPHTKGFFCANQAGDLLWYNSITKTWTTHNVNADDFVIVGEPTDGAYIRRGDQIVKWQPNGTETVITTVSGSLGYGDIYVFDDQVIVNKIGIWRAWR